MVELDRQIAETPAVTLAGAIAKIEMAADVIRGTHVVDGSDVREEELCTDEIALLGALEDLKRLLPRTERGA